jgi:AraC-like DNA-binding protein
MLKGRIKMIDESCEIDILKEIENDEELILEEQEVLLLEEIIKQMESKKIDRAELARRLGTSRAYVTKLFRTNTNFTLRSMVQIARAIDSCVSIHLTPKDARTAWFDLYEHHDAYRYNEQFSTTITQYKKIVDTQIKVRENEHSPIAA